MMMEAEMMTYKGVTKVITPKPVQGKSEEVPKQAEAQESKTTAKKESKK